MENDEQRVEAFRPPDEVWKKMKRVYDVCEKEGINPPDNVISFFNGETPDEQGVKIDLTQSGRSKYICVAPYKSEMESGWEVDLTLLPEGITILRFIHSYD